MNRTIQITLTYVGAVIGAGFVSGQEILQFFVVYGAEGLILALITGILFAGLGMTIVIISQNLKIDSYYQFFFQFGGKRFGLVADLILTLFLFSSFIIMLVGSKEVFNYLFDFQLNLGLLLTLVIVLITSFYGLDGILTLNSVLIPILLIIIVLLVVSIDLDISYLEFELNIDHLSSAVVYTGYNLVLALTVLLPLVNKFSKQELILGIGGAGFILGSLAFLLTLMLQKFEMEIIGEQLPMLKAVNLFSPQLYYFYALTLWVAMLTTASCNLYAILDRLQDLVSLKRKQLLIILLILIIPATQFSFASLVEIIYPKLGTISLTLFSTLLIKHLLTYYL